MSFPSAGRSLADERTLRRERGFKENKDDIKKWIWQDDDENIKLVADPPYIYQTWYKE